MASQTPQNFEMDVYLRELNRLLQLNIEAIRSRQGSRIRIFYDEDNVGGGSRHSGLSDEQIQKVPTTEISKQQVEDESSCSVCLMNYKEGDTVSKLPCNHFYHTGCIKQWLAANITCPYCRAQVKM